MSRSISAADGQAESAAEGALETVEVLTGPDPRNAVIWLHGLGADGHDFESVVPMLGLQRDVATRFIFPHAPIRPVTLNAGMRMRAWYDIRGLQLSRDQDEAGIMQSARQVEALIRRENERGIPTERIVLAGFSQGGAIAVHVATRYPEKLAGLMALSTYLLFPQRLSAERHAANASTEVFIGHGTMDPMVPVTLGQDLAARLRALSYPVSWHHYPIPHAVSPDEIADIGRWLADRLG
jgi:phospholipase/carboxylesterase